MLVSVYPLRVRGRRLKIEAARRQVPAKVDLRTLSGSVSPGRSAGTCHAEG